ncbi:MAG TPA: FlgD immunoglobulin-like domain containing protein [Stellaceae bacterium]|nr:FlgD immunoglobulin-like domain containing protein [Stellaceae bacterium]
MTSAASTLPASVVTLPTGTQLASNSSNSTSALLNENDFLTLLTTQLEKQDPLNPQSPSDFAAELAQFSTASGVQNLNSTVTTTSGLQAASLVGHNVAVAGNTLSLGDGGNAAGALQLSAAATDVSVQISNAQGKIVATLDLGAMPAGTQNFTWSGQGSNGQALASGTYSFAVSATGAKGASVTATPYAVAPVTAVSFGGSNGATLELGNGIAPTALSAVQQVF